MYDLLCGWEQDNGIHLAFFPLKNDGHLMVNDHYNIERGWLIKCGAWRQTSTKFNNWKCLSKLKHQNMMVGHTIYHLVTRIYFVHEQNIPSVTKIILGVQTLSFQ